MVEYVGMIRLRVTHHSLVFEREDTVEIGDSLALALAQAPQVPRARAGGLGAGLQELCKVQS